MSPVSAHDIDDFNARARAFLQVHAQAAAQDLVSNLCARVDRIGSGEALFPVTINDDEPDNAWVCSPRTTYGRYAIEEAERYAPKIAAPLLSVVGRGVDAGLRAARIDRAVAINNWCLSTNLYPSHSQVSVPQLLDEALQRWPSHAIWLRSLNDVDHCDWLAECERLGFVLIPSRQVYLFRDVAALARQRHNLKVDLKLAAKQARRAGDADIGENDYARIAGLYGQLYISKYSRCNPHYTAEFMRRWHCAGLLQFDGFRGEEGQLICIAGQFRQGRTLTTPIVGYDTALPQRLGLYRLSTAMTFEHAIRDGCDINFSAGAAGFKRLRGGRPSIEYSAVYARHLPARTRQTLAWLSALTRRLGVPLMRRFEL
jgi:hypothetical protein